MLTPRGIYTKLYNTKFPSRCPRFPYSFPREHFCYGGVGRQRPTPSFRLYKRNSLSLFHSLSLFSSLSVFPPFVLTRGPTISLAFVPEGNENGSVGDWCFCRPRSCGSTRQTRCSLVQDIRVLSIFFPLRPSESQPSRRDNLGDASGPLFFSFSSSLFPLSLSYSP